jgi:hypothetical protein
LPATKLIGARSIGRKKDPHSQKSGQDRALLQRACRAWHERGRLRYLSIYRANVQPYARQGGQINIDALKQQSANWL